MGAGQDTNLRLDSISWPPCHSTARAPGRRSSPRDAWSTASPSLNVSGTHGSLGDPPTPKRGHGHPAAGRVNRRPSRSPCLRAAPHTTYLRGPVRAPAVLVTVEARQQDVLIGVHLAKPQRLLGVVTDHKMAEDQLLLLGALVLKGKGYESQRASD